MRRIFSPGRYANVTATLALLVALSGSAYAASKITGKQIKNGSLTGVDLKANSVGSREVAGLRAADFKSGELRPGPTGPQGGPGPAGPQGAPGSALAYAHVNADGVIDPLRSSNVTLLNKFTGSYCLARADGGAVKNALVTADDTSIVPLSTLVEVTADQARITTFGCPPSTTVLVFTGNPGLVDRAFYVAFIA